MKNLGFLFLVLLVCTIFVSSIKGHDGLIFPSNAETRFATGSLQIVDASNVASVSIFDQIF